MSGDQPRTVELFGPVTASLVQALPEIERRLDRRITVVGGLAVLSRLGSAAHRVTSDVDTVNRRLGGEPGQLDVLLATGATAIDGAGAMVATPTGDVRVDVLEVSEEQLDDLPEDPTDRLYLLSHDWALRSATALHIRAVGGGTTSEHTVQVAEPGPLVATKLQALPNRARVKEATDLVDIVRLTLDDETGPVVRAQLAAADVVAETGRSSARRTVVPDGRRAELAPHQDNPQWLRHHAGHGCPGRRTSPRVARALRIFRRHQY